MRPYVDLHMHTSCSDGTSTPRELLDLVRYAGIAAFAVTDHDTLEGYQAVRQILHDDDAELIPGVELSATVEGEDMHLLGYLFDPEDDRMKSALEDFQHHRSQRGRLMVDKLNELGVDITYEDVESQAGGAVIGRPHVARAMTEKNAVRYYEEAFEKFIGYNGPAYVPKKNFTPDQAIGLIHDAGGLAMLAHPAIDDKERYLDMLIGMGLDGIEVYHPSHSQSHIDRYRHLAERHRLLITGGSDFHGSNGRYDNIGAQKVPYRALENMKAKRK